MTWRPTTEYHGHQIYKVLLCMLSKKYPLQFKHKVLIHLFQVAAKDRQNTLKTQSFA